MWRGIGDSESIGLRPWVGSRSGYPSRAGVRSQIREEAVADTHIQQAAIANSLENFKYVFDKALEGKFIDRMDQNQEIFARYMNDPDFAKVVVDVLRKQVYEQIRTEVKQESVQPSRN
mgnify:CR=1 FL=1